MYSHVDSVQGMAADAAMDTTCPSPELGDSRKRPLDDGTLDDGTSKRSHFSTNGKFPDAGSAKMIPSTFLHHSLSAAPPPPPMIDFTTGRREQASERTARIVDV